MINEGALESVSAKLRIPKDIIEKVYKYYWLFIRTKIGSLPLKEDLTKEEYEKLQTNFNIPSIGKLVCPYDRYLKVRGSFKDFEKSKKNDKD